MSAEKQRDRCRAVCNRTSKFRVASESAKYHRDFAKIQRPVKVSEPGLKLLVVHKTRLDNNRADVCRHSRSDTIPELTLARLCFVREAAINSQVSKTASNTSISSLAVMGRGVTQVLDNNMHAQPMKHESSSGESYVGYMIQVIKYLH